MPILLGIDPGSRKTGFGVVETVSNSYRYVASGLIKVPDGLSFPERLQVIFSGVAEVIARHRPDEFAIEQVFLAKNANSALKLGQARGAAMVAATSNKIPVFEYEARKVKQAITGTGAADKKQIQYMVKMLLNLPKCPQEDAADALAIAICHASSRNTLVSNASIVAFSKKRFR